MPDVLAWPGDLSTLERASLALRSGQVLALPTETGYEAAAFALDATAVARLVALTASEPLAIAIHTPREIFDWAPGLRGAAVRLIREFWPGPLTLLTSIGIERGLARRLPTEVQHHVITPRGLAARCPDRDDLAPLWRSVGGPVVLAPLPPTGSFEIVDVVLEAGPAPLPVPSSIVWADAHRIECLREGAIPKTDLEYAAFCKILFVCTGNTCRSPMAEALCRRLLADTLRDRSGTMAGFEIGSAGMAAMAGSEASPEAAVAVQARGADLRGHVSRPLSVEMLARADHVFTMTGSHLRMLRSLRLPVGPEAQLLSPFGEDVADPIGGPLELYQECAEQIWHCLGQRLPQILEG